MSTIGAILSPPGSGHLFGTDMIGNGVFQKCASAVWTDFLIIAASTILIYFIGLVLGSLLSYFDNKFLREFFLGIAHYWITLPVILIAMLLLVLTGPGQRNMILVLVFSLVPSHALYVCNKLEEIKKQDFVLAKSAYGFSKFYIFCHHLYPSIKKSLSGYTFSRIPEILMISLGLNFIGLGVQSPQFSFGRLLFDGLPYMFSAWWLWVFPVAIIIVFFIF